MKRYKNWEIILNQHLRKASEQTFEYGTRDCCIWPCTVVQAFTGVDLAAPLRGKYNDALSAATVMEEFAGEGIEAMILKIRDMFNVLTIPPMRASRGDLVLLKAQGINGGPAHEVEFLKDGSITALGIVEMDPRYAATFAPEGLIHVPQCYWVTGWKV